MAFKIKVTYFKPSGKYYAEGEFTTERFVMQDVFDDFKEMLANGDRPELVDGHSGLTAVLNCEEHPAGYPAIFYNQA